MNRIPKENRDLLWYVLRRDAFRLFGFAVWVGALLLGAISYNNNHKTYPPERLMIGWKLWLWIALAVLTGFFLFRVWKFFTDRPFRGVIESNGNSRSYSASQDPGATSGASYEFRLNTSLRVRSQDGKLHRIRFEQKNGFYSYYHEGNEIAHFHGLPYPLNLDSKHENGWVCVACGTWYKAKIDRCDHCHHTLIDPDKLK